MTLVFAIAVALLFSAGVFLLLERDLVRMTGGVLLISHAANLYLMASGLTRGEAPVLPVDSPRHVSDPLVQALTLTSVVISVGVSALLLALVLRMNATHRSIDVEVVMAAEEHDEARQAERTAARVREGAQQRSRRRSGDEPGPRGSPPEAEGSR